MKRAATYNPGSALHCFVCANSSFWLDNPLRQFKIEIER
jgi:hypothetical protein